MFVATAALIAALMGTPVGLQSAAGSQSPRPPRAPETDQTVPVTRGARLSVNNFAGEVIVRGWDRDALRVQARHTLRTRVNIRTTSSGVVVVAGSSGAPGSVDYEINVPTWMPVKIEGTYAYIAVEGTQGEVSAETVRGDISIKGGSGFITAKSIEGAVTLENVRGRVTASSVNEGVTISGGNGDILAESTNGHITLSNIESGSVDAGTVNGNIKYDGTATNNGKYRFSTHNGNITVAVPETASATFSVRTYNGSVSSSTLPLQKSGDAARGRRIIYMLGSGSAEFELESFGGTIVLRKRSAVAPAATKKEKDHENES